MREKKNKNRDGIRAAGLIILLCLCMIMPVHAKEKMDTQPTGEETGIQGNIMIAVDNIEGKEAPMKSASVIMDIPEGALLFVTGAEDNGWYEIFYQGQEMYVPADKMEASDIADNAALDQELKKAGEEDAAFIESLEMQRQAIARSKMWRWIIIVLIVAFFITGVVSALREKKKNIGDGKHR